MLTLTILLILFLVLSLGVSIFVIRNLYIQNSVYESWILNFSNRAQKTFDSMKEIDEKQMFEKDDDVGIIFEELYKLIQDLNDKLGDEYEEENNEIDHN